MSFHRGFLSHYGLIMDGQSFSPSFLVSFFIGFFFLKGKRNSRNKETERERRGAQSFSYRQSKDEKALAEIDWGKTIHP